MLDDLKEIIAIDSVYSENAAPRAPFGQKARQALDWFLNKSKEFGFKTGDLDGYCGYGEIGEGKEMIGVLCHLDVVPAGGGWTLPPYKMTVDNGYIYGRGVADDKGALIACMHAMKSILSEGTALKRRIRLIVGCNEENGSSCMKHYVRHAEIPAISIVPDADFPVVGSEKGILRLLVTLPFDQFFRDNILSLSGGTKDNVVPDHCAVKIKKHSPLYEKLKEISALDQTLFKTEPVVSAVLSAGYALKEFSISQEDCLVVEAEGVSAHAMEPEKGDNAVWKIFCFLNAVAGEESEILKAVYEYFCSPLSCEKLRIAACDAVSGDTTVNLGIIETQKDALVFKLDLRLPISADKQSVAPKIAAVLPQECVVEETMYSPNLYVEESSPLIQTLLQVYEKCTGEKGISLKSGGGTYARELPNAVAFGPTFPDQPNNLHQKDECMKVESFEKLFDIYKEAMLRLDKIEL